ncbi:hypothetical protein E2C01_090576 [Portunus trituberculatus]|uniref:Uncharacterized protein n=1 Tax=Portunus trituberculatus TaxID=210409 RepID=A0A5B7JKI8_PORTR|nr:hypothetical protein [Portunus trituberculatus]
MIGREQRENSSPGLPASRALPQMPTGNGCRAGGPRDASGSHTSRSGCGWRPGSRTPYGVRRGGQCPLPEPHSPLLRNRPENGPRSKCLSPRETGAGWRKTTLDAAAEVTAQGSQKSWEWADGAPAAGPRQSPSRAAEERAASRGAWRRPKAAKGRAQLRLADGWATRKPGHQ